jgi:hypothetical protein
MTGVLDQILALVAGARPPAIGDEARNVLRYPATAPATVRTDVLSHTEGGLTTDGELRPRVSVLLGPGATFQGIADGLLALYVTAAGAPGGTPAPTRDELARAIIVYNRLYLPTTTWELYAAGLRLPLPVEIDQASAAWIVNADTVRQWAGEFDGAWLSHLTTAPAPLDLPDPMVALPQEATDLLSGFPPPSPPSPERALGAELMARILRNPFAAVFLVLEVFRHLDGRTVDVTLSLLDGMVDHQAALLGATSAGNGLLRYFDTALTGAPAGTDQTRLDRDRNLISGALFTAPSGPRAPFSELPETAGQLKDRGPVPDTAVGPVAPPGGVHRLVRGRDVGVGKVRQYPNTGTGTKYRGPAYAGGLPPGPFAAADAARLPQDVPSQARLEIVVGIAANEGNLDAIRQRDFGILSSGIHQWSAHSAPELGALISRFKGLAPEEYELFFRMYGLDVIPAAIAGDFQWQSLDASDNPTPLITWAQIQAFFEGTTDAQGVRVFGTTWAARFRLAPLASEAYRRCEILEAIARFDRIKRDVGAITVAANDVPVQQLITSKQGAALLLDSHINKPAAVGPTLKAAAQAPNLSTDPDELDRQLTQVFERTRDVVDRSLRNQRIDAQHFDPAHGSFIGW